MAEDIAQLLGDTALCKGLSRPELLRVAESGRVERWPQGSVVMEEGTAGPRVVVLLEGMVQVLKRDEEGNEQELARVGPGAVLGEMSLIESAPRSATVRALMPLRVFAMDRGTFSEMVEDGDPAALKMGLAIARVLSRRVTALNHKMVELLAATGSPQPAQEFSAYEQRLFTRWDF